MKIFISDIHLGDGSKTEDFHATREFIDFLEYVDKNAEELIIVGDLFELLQADLDEIILCHQLILEKLIDTAQKVKLTYVIGNHDHIPFVSFVNRTIGNVRIALKYQSSDKLIWAEHGNQYDDFNRFGDVMSAVDTPIGSKIARLVALAEKVHPEADNFLFKVVSPFISQRNKSKIVNISPSKKKIYKSAGGDYSEYEEGAKRVLKGKTKVVVFGHTHEALIKKLNGGFYVNCGSWVTDSLDFVEIDDTEIRLVDGLSFAVREAVSWK